MKVGDHQAHPGGLVLQVAVGGRVRVGEQAWIELIERDPECVAVLRLTDPSGEFAPAGFAGSPLVTPVPAGWLVRLGPADLVRLGEETIVGVRAAPSNRALRLVIRAPRAVSVMREELLQRSAVANDVA